MGRLDAVRDGSVNNTENRRMYIYTFLRDNLDDSKTVSEIYEYLVESLGFEGNRKSIARDLEYFDEPSSKVKLIKTYKGTTGLYTVKEDSSYFHSIDLPPEEIETILIALNNLGISAPKLLRERTQKARKSLLAAIPTKRHKEFKRIEKMYHFSYGTEGRSSYRNEKAVDVCIKALHDGQVVEIEYLKINQDGGTESKKRRIAPFLFVMAASKTYLYAYDYGADGNRNFSLARVTGAKLIERKHDMKMDKDEISNLHNSIGGFGIGSTDEEMVDYKIIGNSYFCERFTEVEVHPSQKIRKLSDGSFELTFRSAPSFSFKRHFVAGESGVTKVVEK